MNNPYAMNMIMKQRQAEIRKQADVYRRIEESKGDSGKWSKGKLVMALVSLVLSASVLGLSILM